MKRSFRYQIYDLRRNEFSTEAVTEWLSQTHNAGTEAYLKDVSLQHGTDRSEKEQLQAIIDVERTAIRDGFLGLADEASAVWSGCSRREFNIGYDFGSKPWAFN